MTMLRSGLKLALGAFALVIVAASHGTNKHLFKDLSWDPVKDFEPVVYTHVVPLLLTVHPSVPAKTVPELVAWIKANPDKAIVAHSGTGSSLHMATELFMSMTNTKLQMIPYKGSSAAHPDLLAGRTNIIFDPITAIAGHVKAGSLRGIAVTTTQRSKLEANGIEIQGGTPEHFGNIFKAEVDKWGRMIKAAGIKAD